MNQPYTLLLRLEGPMQSWGYRSRFVYRDTALEPTRSGVIGLICAAMGIARGEDISLFNAIRMGVLVENEGRPECDYHTAMNVIKADGKLDEKKSTVVSYRDYLADAMFIVGLESKDKNLLDKIAESLRNPKWILFLGRKAFPLAWPPLKPTDSPIAGTLEDCLHTDQSAKRVMIESADGERVQYDWPLCFGERRFMPRSIKTCFEKKGDR